MFKIGIFNDHQAIQPVLEQQLDVTQYSCFKIETKETVSQYDGIILFMETTEQLSKIIEWLLFCQKFPKTFVWIVSKVYLDEEENILLILGANTVVRAEKSETVLPVIIKNTFTRMETYPELKCGITSEQLLNEKNQSVLVNGEECSLTRSEFKLLSILEEHKETAVEYAFLCDRMFTENSKREIFQLSNIVCHIRKKVKKSSAFSIKTVRSKGYMLTMNS